MPQNQSDQNRYDTAWKWAIEQEPRLFIEFFLKALSKEIDYRYEIKFLNPVLNPIESDSETIDREADEILEVRLKNGDEMWVLVHIEMQNYSDNDFNERMFSYYYRIFDKHNKNIVSLAVLTDLNENFRPQPYKQDLFGTKINFEYNVVKLIDYSKKELLASDNPFAMIVLVHLEAMKAGRNNNKKFDAKVRLTELLKEKGYSSKFVELLFVFMDTEIRLPKDLEKKYEEKIGESVMTHIVTSWEERGIEQGMQQGMQQGILQTAKQMIRKNMDVNLIAEITGLTKKDIADIKNDKTPNQINI